MLPMSLAGCLHQSDAQLESSRELEHAPFGTADQEAHAEQLSARIAELERRLDPTRRRAWIGSSRPMRRPPRAAPVLDPRSV